MYCSHMRSLVARATRPGAVTSPSATMSRRELASSAGTGSRPSTALWLRDGEVTFTTSSWLHMTSCSGMCASSIASCSPTWPGVWPNPFPCLGSGLHSAPEAGTATDTPSPASKAVGIVAHVGGSLWHAATAGSTSGVRCGLCPFASEQRAALKGPPATAAAASGARKTSLTAALSSASELLPPGCCTSVGALSPGDGTTSVAGVPSGDGTISAGCTGRSAIDCWCPGDGGPFRRPTAAPAPEAGSDGWVRSASAVSGAPMAASAPDCAGETFS